ncbi:FUSC family protein [Edwardsiella ictaluri]|uniref:Membrane protein, putative n=3 Tax=Pseudomonadota TaxID=1224 RepID=C5BAH1_EDWI9|nr:FUSC family protein [Edwardsiella ictaluri]ACR69941.1 membrane protein, putative [Edwardsiella ictaluri 93-146]AVZ83129.1 FUSC family protein [Edwardsiella ictaluri]EKS7764249.1 FUSC family protein [Edwardsiella ictaluri]EKS7771108.1 FUSC family protein [Edwardsiella ictaluri]EKS7774200.1 FUSC family protein [Edwardsiella ictaluri]
MLLQSLKALRLTLAVMLSLYIAMRLGMHSPDWAVTSALIVSLGTIGQIRSRWWQRIVGNFVGGSIGFFVIWWLAQDPFSIMLCAALFGSVCTYISLTHFQYKDMWRWVIIGFIIVFSASLSSPSRAFSVLFDRVGCVFIGSSVIFIFNLLWPLEYAASWQKQYHAILEKLDTLLNKDDADAVALYLELSQKIDLLRQSLSLNYGDYRIIYAHEYNVINSIYALEKFSRHLYSLRMQHALDSQTKAWISAAITAVKAYEPIPPVTMAHSSRYASLLTLIAADLHSIVQKNASTDAQSRFRWQWQNRMFSAGTDSAFTSSLLFFVSCILSLLLWRYGWPGGPQVMLLTAVLLVMCQYGERMSPKGFAIGFSIGTLFAFPIFIFLLPNLHNANAFWLSMLLIYFPVAFVMNGQYKVRAIPLIAFAVAVMINANSHNYVPGNDYFNGYTTFLFALIAVITISSAVLSLLVVNDTETRLKAQIEGWAKERQRFLSHRGQERSKILVRLERRTDIILSLYSKLDPAQQEIWRKRISAIPLMLTRIQRWEYLETPATSTSA